MNALERLKKAQERVMARFPQWASRIIAFPLVETRDIAGLSFDQWGRIYFNPQFVDSEPIRSLAGTFFLLIYIELNDLGKKFTGKDEFVWMIACMLEASGNFEDSNQVGLPQNAVYPGFYNFPNRLSAAQYYRRLMKMDDIPLPFTLNDSEGNEVMANEKFTYSPGDSPLSFGSGFSEGSSISFPWELEGEWQKPEIDPILESILAQKLAREQARAGTGSGPGNGTSDSLLKAMLGDTILPWQSHLDELLGRLQSQNGGSLEYSFGIPSGLEDVLDEDMMLPGCAIRGMELALIVDTSGSMEGHMESADSRLSLAFNEAKGILSTLNPANGIVVISADAQVKNVQRVYSPNEIRFKGGGGTYLTPGIRKAASLKPRPDAVIIITDGECHWMSKKPSGIEVVVLNINWRWSQTELRNYFPVPKWAHLIEMFPPDRRPM